MFLGNLPPNVPFLLLHHRPLSSTSVFCPNELNIISTLIHSICNSDNHPTAIHLLSAALLTSPAHSSTFSPHPFPHSSSLPLLLPPHNPTPPPPPLPHPLFSSLLISSFIQRCRIAAAAQVFYWLCSEDTPCRPNEKVYGV